MQALIRIKRAYEAASADDGYRVFVDRLWPRGMSKVNFKYDMWCKDLAPSSELRKWFGHKVENWPKFKADYIQELDNTQSKERMSAILKAANGANITLLYGAKDTEHNQAVVLAEILSSYAKTHK